MSSSRRRFLVGSGMAAVSAALNPAALLHALSSDDAIAELEEAIPRWMEQYGVPGLSVAVVREARLAWSQGFGVKNANTDEVVDANTIFQAASLSKPIFAYGVLKLWEQGRLDLDRPLVDTLKNPYVPFEINTPNGLPLMADPNIPDDPRLKLITPRHVLSQTTGFPNWSRGRPLRFLSEPGAQFGYSGEAHNYLQRVIEHVTGHRLDGFLKAAVLGPLGMTASSYIWQESFERDAAWGHFREGRPSRFPKPERGLAAGTLHSTAPEFARFLIALLGPAAGNSALLGPSGVRAMLEPQVKIDANLSWGLGVGLEHTEDGDAFWQWGDDGIFRHFTLGSAQSRSAVVVFTNSMNGMKACRDVVLKTMPGPHPSLSFRMVNY